ncbi:uncharacterized protein LOC131651222 [Vicia villosa]|uniref:uncharacterized protein LOC131651222 n=1 Tax=Vicia villosa TaxID=3911 RepID=UPI00273A9D06|nr:uncharacterized protein LOC131651222 [Vicia villosa]
MELCGDLMHSEMICSFVIAKVASQLYPEIDPAFIERNGDEISKSWTILNNQGVHHELIYNQKSFHPLIISGWPCLQCYYDLPADVVLKVGYYGNNNYGLLSIKEVVRDQDLPRFHSRYVMHKDIRVFDVILPPFGVDLPKFKLQEDFATTLIEHGYEHIVLCGDNGKPCSMSVLKFGAPMRMKLGYGWDEFCKANNFKVGDRLQFRFDVTSLNRRCYVYLFSYPY